MTKSKCWSLTNKPTRDVLRQHDVYEKYMAKNVQSVELLPPNTCRVKTFYSNCASSYKTSGCNESTAKYASWNGPHKSTLDQCAHHTVSFVLALESLLEIKTPIFQTRSAKVHPPHWATSKPIALVAAITVTAKQTMIAKLFAFKKLKILPSN